MRRLLLPQCTWLGKRETSSRSLREQEVWISVEEKVFGTDFLVILLKFFTTAAQHVSAQFIP